MFSPNFQLYIVTLASVLLVLRPPPLYTPHHTQYIKANLHKENTLASNNVMYVYYFYSDVQKNRTEPKPRSGVKTEPKPTEIF